MVIQNESDVNQDSCVARCRKPGCERHERSPHERSDTGNGDHDKYDKSAEVVSASSRSLEKQTRVWISCRLVEFVLRTENGETSAEKHGFSKETGPGDARNYGKQTQFPCEENLAEAGVAASNGNGNKPGFSFYIDITGSKMEANNLSRVLRLGLRR